MLGRAVQVQTGSPRLGWVGFGGWSLLALSVGFGRLPFRWVGAKSRANKKEPDKEGHGCQTVCTADGNG